MSNPAPRPALRKAPDSQVNPALPTGTQIDLRNRETPLSISKKPDLGVEPSPGTPPAKKDKQSTKKHRKKIKAKLERSAKARRKLRATKK